MAVGWEEGANQTDIWKGKKHWWLITERKERGSSKHRQCDRWEITVVSLRS